MKITWTPEKDALVSHLIADGIAIDDVAAELGTTVRSVAARRERLRAADPDHEPRFKWSAERSLQLRRMRSEGMRSDEIAPFFGITLSAVATQCTRLKLCESHVTNAQVEAIVELATEGATLSRIAKRHQIDAITVERILLRHGVAARTLPSSYRGPDRMRASR